MDGDAGDSVRQARLDGRHPGQVVLLIGALVVAAPDHVLDELGVHPGPRYQPLHDGDGQVQGGEGFELAVDGADGGAAPRGDYDASHLPISPLQNDLRVLLPFIQEQDPCQLCRRGKRAGTGLSVAAPQQAEGQSQEIPAAAQQGGGPEAAPSPENGLAHNLRKQMGRTQIPI